MPDSPAAAANLRKGDIIVSIDGSAVESAREIQQHLAGGEPEHKLAVKRRGKEITITVTIDQ